MPGKPDDRRARNIVYAALVSLLLIWVVKFAMPSGPIIGTIAGHTTTSEEIIQDPANLPPSNTRLVPSLRPTPSPLARIEGPYNGTIYDKVAVIVEDRPRINLIPLVLHFHAVLGPDWPIIIYTSSDNVGIFASSAPLNRILKSGVISIRILPSTVLFTNSESVSRFLTKSWLWEDLAPAHWVLMFQSDSMLCSNAARVVEDFFDYDFVGAPIAPHLGPGMNGGFSLRKRETFLAITEEFDWETDRGRGFEDRWFYDKILELIRRDEELGGVSQVKMPSMEVARTFSVETIDFPHPLGVHQVHRWLKEQMVSLDDWCPEWKICSQEYVKDVPGK